MTKILQISGAMCNSYFLFVLNPEEKDMYRYNKYHLPVKFGIQAWIFWFNFMLDQILQFRLFGWKQPLNKLLISVIFFVHFLFCFLSLVNTHACSQHTAQVPNQSGNDWEFIPSCPRGQGDALPIVDWLSSIFLI